MSSFICIPIRYKDAKLLPNYKNNKIICNEQKTSTACNKQWNTFTNDQMCVWKEDTLEIGILQSPWVKSITSVQTEFVSEQEAMHWQEKVSMAPDKWIPNKAQNEIPNLLSVKFLHIFRVILPSIQWRMHKI